MSRSHIFDFNNLVKFSLFLLSLKFLLNINRYNESEQSKNLSHLLKFWMFYSLISFTFDFVIYITYDSIFNKVLQLVFVYYLFNKF